MRHKRILSLFLSMVMVLSLIPVFSISALAENEKVLDRILFLGDQEWGEYLVNGTDQKLSEEDLAIKVYDQYGNLVDTNEYSMTFKMVWFNESTEEDEYEDVLLPIGVAEKDKEEGFTEYQVNVKAKDGSSYSGECYSRFSIIDQYTLNFHCGDCHFSEEYYAGGFMSWHSYYKIPLGKMEDPYVGRKDGVELVKDKEYKLTYFTRDDSVLADGEYTDEKEKKRYSEADPLQEMPTEIGTYFVKIEGLNPYYGTTWLDFDIVVEEGDLPFSPYIEFAEGEDNRLFTDRTEDKVFYLMLDDFRDTDFENEYDFQIDLAFWDFNRFDWDVPDEDMIYFEEGVHYDTELFKDEDCVKVSLDVPMVFERMAEEEFSTNTIGISAEITERDSGKLVGASRGAIEICEPTEDRDKEEDRDLLPNWEHYVNEQYHARLCNEQYPEGIDYDYTVTDVRVISGENAVEIEAEDNDGNFWRCVAVDYGTAEIEVSYDDPYTGPGSYIFTLSVKNEIYEFDIFPTEACWKMLPGTEKQLECNLRHAYRVENEDGGYDEWEDIKDADISWSIVDDSGLGTVEVSPEDSYIAVLKAREMTQEEIERGLDGDVVVLAKASRNGEVVAEREDNFFVGTMYTQIYPLSINEDLFIGQSEDVTAELRYFSYGEDDYQVIRSAKFFMGYDEDAVKITDKNGTEIAPGESGISEEDGTCKFTVERLNDWDTDIELRAEWNWLEGDFAEDFQHYHLNNVNLYDELWFEDMGQDAPLYNDGTKTIELKVGDRLQAVDPWFKITAGVWGEDGWEEVLTEGEDYKINDKQITFYGEAAYSKIGGINCRVEAKAMSGDQELTEADYWFDLREAYTEVERNNEELFIDEHSWVDKELLVYVENSDYPYGEQLRYAVTGIEIENPDVIECSEEENGWDLIAKNYGGSDVILSYQDYKGKDSECRFFVEVVKDKYGVSIFSTAPTSNIVLAGSSIVYKAEMWHQNENGESSTDGLTLKWKTDYFSTEEIEPFITVEAIPLVPTQCLVAADPDTPVDGRGNWFGVAAVVYNGEEEVAYEVMDTLVTDETYVPSVSELDPFFGVGQTKMIDYQLHRYTSADPEQPEIIPDVHFVWEYDREAVEIRDAAGDLVGYDTRTGEYNDSEYCYGTTIPFTITRLKSYFIPIDLKVYSGDEELCRWAYDLYVVCETHQLTKHDAKPATYEEDGNIEYWTCDICGKYFSDEEGKTEITQEDTVLHKLVDLSKATIEPIASVKYTGKKITPVPTVILSDGSIADSDHYTVSYDNNINAGKATVTVKGKDYYTGSVKTTFTIKKATPTITTAKKTVKAAKVKKKAQTVSGAIIVKNAYGKVTYVKVAKGSSANLTINKTTGKITVKKGTKKGTYKIKVKVTAAKSSNNTKLVKTVTAKIVVK